MIEISSQTRILIAISLLAVMIVWESYRPYRKMGQDRLRHGVKNISLGLIGSLLAHFTGVIWLYASLTYAREQGWGWISTEWHWALQLIATIVFFDWAIHLQHWIMHIVPVFWRLHRVHHTDRDFDTTTALRFHPFEILISYGYKSGLVLIAGPPMAALIIYEMLLNGMAIFNHGNVSLPSRFDRVLRWVIVTPDMHRIHHSEKVDETNSNYGNTLSIWDRIYGFYRDQPGEQFVIGLREWKQESKLSLMKLLKLPFERT